MRGFSELANEIFDLPIYLAEQSNLSGVHANFRAPQYSTAVGLIRYAQILDAEREADTSGSVVSRAIKSIWPFKR
jgi:cell division protein FtsA